MSNIFSSLKNAYTLFKSVDFQQLEELSKKVDLPKAIDSLGHLDDNQLNGLMKMLGSSHKKKELPPY